MAMRLNRKLQRFTWLAFLLVALLLPIASLAHDLSHDHDSGTLHTVDLCLFCQVGGQHNPPLPASRHAIEPPVHPLLTPLVSADSRLPNTLSQSAIRVRGPPTP